MSEERLFCPDAMNKNCPVYRNWVEQTGDSGISDPVSEGGIGCNDELRLRLNENSLTGEVDE